jgi:aminomethyltransferase
MSPSLNFGIGLGYVNIGFEEIDSEIFIKIRKNIKKAIIVKTPFK